MLLPWWCHHSINAQLPQDHNHSLLDGEGPFPIRYVINSRPHFKDNNTGFLNRLAQAVPAVTLPLDGRAASFSACLYAVTDKPTGPPSDTGRVWSPQLQAACLSDHSAHQLNLYFSILPQENSSPRRGLPTCTGINPKYTNSQDISIIMFIASSY